MRGERPARRACIAATLVLIACRSKAPPTAEASAAPAPGALVSARPYDLDVPPGLDPTKPAPLLLVLHGYGDRAASFGAASWSLTTNASARGILVARPDGTLDSKGRRFWNATDSCCDFDHTGTDDVAYLTAVLDDVAARHRVDPKRTWVLGLSNGGFMAHRLACDRADRVAAIVSLAGAAWKDPARCSPSAPVSVLEVHGTADRLVAYDGGASIFGGSSYPSVLDSVAQSAAKAGCSGALAPVGVSAGFDARHPQEETRSSSWSGCPKGIDVALWAMLGSEHIPSVTPAWSEAVVTWLEQHPKP
jgi:polyhydroxybutyrate depolymerase